MQISEVGPIACARAISALSARMTANARRRPSPGILRTRRHHVGISRRGNEEPRNNPRYDFSPATHQIINPNSESLPNFRIIYPPSIHIQHTIAICSRTKSAINVNKNTEQTAIYCPAREKYVFSTIQNPRKQVRIDFSAGTFSLQRRVFGFVLGVSFLTQTPAAGLACVPDRLCRRSGSGKVSLSISHSSPNISKTATGIMAKPAKSWKNFSPA